jgi:hypothetical protein
MKSTRLLFVGLAVVLAAGCTHKRPTAPQAPATVRWLGTPTEIAVPLPAETPFDTIPEARAVYLEYFARAYRLAATGNGTLGCMCMLEDNIDHYEAAVRGYTVGTAAGMEASARDGPPKAAPASHQK